TFEAMLTAEGKETLATNALLSAVVPAMAHTHVGISQTEQVRTHEEDETCEFATKAKLFELKSASWSERGGGQLRVNRHNDTKRCRLVMRTDQTFRLILNVPLFSGMKFVCDGRFIRFTCFDAETMAPVTYALRFPSEAVASEAHRHVESAVPTDVNVGAHEDANGSSDEDSGGSSDDANGSSDEDAEDSADEDVKDSADEDVKASEGSADKGKGKAAVNEDDDSEDDEDYEESGSESDDNVLDSDVDNTGSECDSDTAPAPASSSKS
ncbi:hypothetical protein GGH98_003589, partial [Coemansia sp. RSA 454]